MTPVMAYAAGTTAVATGVTGRPPAATPLCVTMTLYDLIAALQARMGPDGDMLVVTRVVDLLRSGRFTWHAPVSRGQGPAGVRSRFIPRV
jgi:hypothetical protein